MKKIIIKTIIFVLGICFLVFIMSKVYHLIIINKVRDAIENFRSEKNKYYSVVIHSDNNIIEEEIMMKDGILKWNEKKEDRDFYCEWKDFDCDKEYSIDFCGKSFTENTSLKANQDFLNNLPRIILEIYQNDKFNLDKLLAINYVVSIEYNNQKCYKLVTTTQELIINKNTYLPVYYSLKLINTNPNSNNLVENTYEFKVGEVTDEEVQLPDLTGYTKISEK